MTAIITPKRGNVANIPTSGVKPGELLITSDTQQAFVGKSDGSAYVPVAPFYATGIVPITIAASTDLVTQVLIGESTFLDGELITTSNSTGYIKITGQLAFKCFSVLPNGTEVNVGSISIGTPINSPLIGKNITMSADSGLRNFFVGRTSASSTLAKIRITKSGLIMLSPGANSDLVTSPFYTALLNSLIIPVTLS